MQVVYEKQAIKFLKTQPEQVRKKIYKGINDICEFKGDIKFLKCGNYSGMYRYKMAHYRIIFKHDKNGNLIIICTIDTRTNIKY